LAPDLRFLRSSAVLSSRCCRSAAAAAIAVCRSTMSKGARTQPIKPTVERTVAGPLT
jgi:hypothetical protein